MIMAVVAWWQRRQRAERLRRYAQRLTRQIGALSALLFVEDVDNPAAWYDLVNRYETSKFIKLRGQRQFPQDYPNVRHGLIRWTLRPRKADDIDALAFHVIACCCSLDMIAVRRSVKRDRVKYRFLLMTDSHAHCGVITLAGDAVVRLLSEARRRSSQARPR